MDERRTLALLAWTVGSLVGIMFLLNAVALSLVPQPGMAAQRTPPEPPAVRAVTLRLATNTRPATGPIE